MTAAPVYAACLGAPGGTDVLAGPDRGTDVLAGLEDAVLGGLDDARWYEAEVERGHSSYWLGVAAEPRTWVEGWTRDAYRHPGRVVSAGTLELLSEDGDLAADGHTHLLPVVYDVTGAQLDDLDAWYLDEHVGMLLACPDWLSVRRYAVHDPVGEVWTRVVLHELSSPDVMTTPEVLASLATPWRRALARQPWFFLGGGRIPHTRRR